MVYKIFQTFCGDFTYGCKKLCPCKFQFSLIVDLKPGHIVLTAAHNFMPPAHNGKSRKLANLKFISDFMNKKTKDFPRG